MKRIYEIGDWEDGDEESFLKLIARKKGKLLKVDFTFFEIMFLGWGS